MIKKKIKWGFLLLSFIFLYSCLSKQEVKKEIKNQNNNQATEAISSNNDKKSKIKKANEEEKFVYNEQADNSDEVPHSILEVREALEEGRYKKVIRLTQNKDDFYNKYYRGIAYMTMMLQKSRFSSQERIDFRNNAEELLQEVGYQATDDNLKARGLLWYGVTLDLAYSDLKNKKKAIGAFYKIESSRLKDTNYFNDALFYAAQTYARMGWYGVSRNYFKKSSKIGNGNDVIYDYVNNEFYSSDDIGNIGSERLKSYVEGYNIAYKNQ